MASRTVSVLLGNGDGTFQAAVTYGSGGSSAYFVAVGGCERRRQARPGRGELRQRACSNSVSVLLGNGDGTFQAAVTYGSGGSESFSVAMGDFNGDGKPDLAWPTTVPTQ